MDELLLITPTEALAVVAGTVGMYVAMVVLVKVLGQRMLATMSSYDLAAVVAFGAIIGRASLGEVPRLAAGVLALATLILLQAIAGMIRVTRSGNHAVAVPPVVLMAGSTVIEENMKRCHVVQHELASRLRQAGIRHRGEVAAVVFEPSGAISVLRRGDGIEPQLLEGVRGADLVPRELLR
ncbi:DUF421 domain-containing protein [Ruania alkalisoli]|uniref:DUF421 domain-containing protein n=1 Tax=Ruania alkalisoli TaxID=2779775 RepID=A0A7M1SUL0_9MICO|nr:YetF domain-containing protein [Ruania alkalisoli]QOR71171.1 DUF421 domain-containing protein [Ruania alkalisoli]